MPLGGTYDGGRDAQLCSFHAKDAKGGDVFFQYSLEKKWERKLERELKKVHNKGHKISKFIFITSQNVTGTKMDKLRYQVKNDYGWELIIYEREWLRLQLEEGHRDLADKYLGIPPTSYQGRIMQESEKATIEDKKPLELISNEKYEEAIPLLKISIDKSINNEEIYNALAWCYYMIHDYKNASIYIDSALQIEPQSTKSKSIKGIILAEDGIETNSKPKLLLAKDIFINLIEVRKDWTIYYNLANTFSALGEYEIAKKTYIKSLKYSNKEAIVWKNLGTCYSHLGDHKRELKCMNRALSINPQLSQALISKGITLGVVYEKYADGLKLINSALENDKFLAYHWPIAYYWKAKFLSNLNENRKALNQLEDGLGIAPDNIYLLNLKAQLLSQLWRFDRNYLLKAAEFYESRIRINDGELQSIKELALIYYELGQDDKFLGHALKLINSFAELSNPLSKEDIETINISTTNIICIINNIYMYDGYRETIPLNEYIKYFNNEFAKELDKIFWLFFGSIFAKTCDTIRGSKEWKEISWSCISKQNELSFIELLPLITKRICKKYSDCSKEKRMDIMSEATVNLPYISLLETSREVGYLAGYYGRYYSVSSEEIDDRMDDSIAGPDVGGWYNNVIEIVMSNANDELNILKEEACRILSRELIDLNLI